MPSRQARVNLTLTDEVMSDLQQWSEQSGHTVTSLCTWLVKRSLVNAKQSGEFQPKDSDDALDLMREFFDSVAGGKYYADKDLAKLAIELDISVDHLIEHQRCYQKGGAIVGN